MKSSHQHIDLILEKSTNAFREYRKQSPEQRKTLLYRIANGLEKASSHLVSVAVKETHLPNGRLEAELKRTAFQLRSYADFMASGLALDIRITPGNANHNPPIPSLAKMNVPLGVVAIFGAGNFPFAYSTAGGDTACALAAGCTVIEKAHPAHIETSRAVSKIIQHEISGLNLHPAIFQHTEGGFETGEALVKHPLLAAVGFTGSFNGGKQLFDWGAQRETPIPVFAEMGSVNPVFLLPTLLSSDAVTLAQKLSASISQDAGQFCTNPGIMVAIDSDDLKKFKAELSILIADLHPKEMLHEGIYENFERNKSAALAHKGVKIIARSTAPASGMMAETLVAETTAAYFLSHPGLQEEVFGSYSLLVVCEDEKDLLQVAGHLRGQLTCSVFGTLNELKDQQPLLNILREKCGRLILNGVPTGVTVATAMQHGGPFPATTDARYGAVGGDGIKRFMRPVCYQGWPDELLPAELQAANPLSLWRMVDEKWMR